MDSNMVLKTHLKNADTGERVSAQAVIVADFDMPFGSMVTFMVKWALASIPALIILWIIGAIAFVMLAGFFGSIFHRGY